ncbi:MAG TPA: helix-turn-helix transcriptional regulator [Acidimicrobiales bacterium]|nr:helix-turn-helix transcriptional regulator [Acidimicrobiales bacterium]
MTQLGQLLQRLRLDAGLTLYELERRSGINRSTLQRMETGSTTNPDTKTLNALARFFGIDAEQLYDAVWQEADAPLPSPAVYFRSKYRLNTEQIAEIEATIRRTTEKPRKGGDKKNKPDKK